MSVLQPDCLLAQLMMKTIIKKKISLCQRDRLAYQLNRSANTDVFLMKGLRRKKTIDDACSLSEFEGHGSASMTAVVSIAISLRR